VTAISENTRERDALMWLKFAIGLLLTSVSPTIPTIAQEAAPKPQNQAAITILKVTASPRGVRAEVRGHDIGSLAASIDKQDKDTPTFMHLVRGFDIPNVPDALRNTLFAIALFA
jgi:hypothetical protein